jgi:hypothetical protein
VVGVVGDRSLGHHRRRLDYYDDKEQTKHQAKWVKNVIDRYSCIHVMAHTQYWAGPFFARYLYEGVTGISASKLREAADRGLVNRARAYFQRVVSRSKEA